MKVVLDTNVIVAAYASRGVCNELFEICALEHDVFSSTFILQECKEKFKTKIKLPTKLTKEIIDYLKSASTIVKPSKLDPKLFSDQNDLPVLGTAVAAEADVLLTGDKALQTLKKINETKILSPREFWSILTT